MLEIRLPASSNEEVLQVASILVKNGYIVKKRVLTVSDKKTKVHAVIAYTEGELNGTL